MSIQLVQVLDMRNRRRPILLQDLHPPFDARLLLRPTYKTKQRLEGVMTGQSRVTLVDLPASTFEQIRHNRLRVVPPDFARHTVEESEGLDQAVQNRFGSLGRQGQ